MSYNLAFPLSPHPPSGHPLPQGERGNKESIFGQPLLSRGEGKKKVPSALSLKRKGGHFQVVRVYSNMQN